MNRRTFFLSAAATAAVPFLPEMASKSGLRRVAFCFRQGRPWGKGGFYSIFAQAEVTLPQLSKLLMQAYSAHDLDTGEPLKHEPFRKLCTWEPELCETLSSILPKLDPTKGRKVIFTRHGAATFA
jgi:hypothetical protein